MRNNTKNETSQIRFGGYDDDKLKRGHDIIFIETIDNKSWKLPLQSIDFTKKNILGSPSSALINPGYPFIAAPIKEFEIFKDELRQEYPEDPVVCSAWDWCYFIHPCEAVANKLPPLKFTFGTEKIRQTYELAPENFLF